MLAFWSDNKCKGAPPEAGRIVSHFLNMRVLFESINPSSLLCMLKLSAILMYLTPQEKSLINQYLYFHPCVSPSHACLRGKPFLLFCLTGRLVLFGYWNQALAPKDKHFTIERKPIPPNFHLLWTGKLRIFSFQFYKQWNYGRCKIAYNPNS